MSGDIGLTWQPDALSADFTVAANDLVQDGGLQTSVILSLFCDRPAEPGDVLPDGETDKRGWWADAFPVVPGDRFGSRLWLLARSKHEVTVLTRAQTYALEALQWLTDDKVAQTITASAAFFTDGRQGYVLTIAIVKPNGNLANFKFDRTWAAEAARV